MMDTSSPALTRPGRSILNSIVLMRGHLLFIPADQGGGFDFDVFIIMRRGEKVKIAKQALKNERKSYELS